MAFELPVKDIIVNEDLQVALLEDDGTAYLAADATPTAGGIIMPGFLELTLGSEFDLLSTGVRIIKSTAVAAVAQISTYLVTSTSATADTTFRLVYDSLDKTGTEFQNVLLEKRYQIPVLSSAATIATAIATAINADKAAPVTASVSTATVTLTSKTTGVSFTLYSDNIVGTQTVTTAASLGLGIYDTIKNINWAANPDIDRNLQYLPRIGAAYTQYYFRLTRNAADGGGEGEFPSVKKQAITSDFRIFVRNGLTLETKLNLLVTDLNV